MTGIRLAFNYTSTVNEWEKCVEEEPGNSKSWFGLGRNAHGGTVAGLEFSELECYEQVRDHHTNLVQIIWFWLSADSQFASPVALTLLDLSVY